MHLAKRSTSYGVAGILAVTMLVASCTSNAENGAGSQHVSPPVEQTHSPGTQTGTTAPSTADTATTDTPGPYAAEIKAAADKADSQFEQDVLKDGVITREEYLEAVNKYKSCMADHGIKVQFEDHNGYYQMVIISDTSRTDDDADTSCSKGTIHYIGNLYQRMVTDPNNEGPFAARYSCLKRLGLTPDGYTLQQYVNDMHRSAATLHYVDGTLMNTPGDVIPNFPFDMSDPRYGACVNNPENPVFPSDATS